jgi:hypothetical protein
MDIVHNIDTSTRVALLASSLRQVRGEGDRLGAADAIHQLRNCILTAQGALGLVEARLAQGRDDEIEKLLDLAESRLREARALIVQTSRRRLCPARPMTLAA